jgi:cell division protein FtsL
MSRYNTFLTLFIVATLAFISFFIFYLQGIFSVMLHVQDYAENNPFEVFSTIFSPGVISSAIIAGVTSLTNRILGIVWVAKCKTIADGEKALWIVGFILMSFITSIVFLIIAKGKKIVE